MKFTLSWLKRHLETEAGAAAIAERLTMLGIEVESLEDPAEALADFTVGRVVAAEPHPNADRLKLCRVEAGGGAVLQIVCGAPNAREGIKVVLATPGARIPANGECLKKGKIRGVESEGMMCSWRELGLGEDHAGIAELDPGAPVGAPVGTVLDLDPVFDVAVTPNRPDWLGVRGIARDLAAAGLGALRPMPVAPVPARIASPIQVRLEFTPETANACPQFAGRYIRGVRNGDSPEWLKRWLLAVGLRPISALVDITNFFAIDQARPLHVFDADKISGDIRARLARPGERVDALNGKTYELDESVTVIADEAGARALGGVIGGEDSGCTEATVNVFLESALFDPTRTAATGRRLNIESDARHRFERGVDPASAVPAMEMATRMILDLCGGEPSEPVIAGAEPDWRRGVPLRPARVRALGGVEVSDRRCVEILAALGCTVREGDGGLEVSPPSWRGDIEGEHDLVEEVVRINGYDNIPVATLPRAPMPQPVLTQIQRRTGWARRDLAARGLVETVTGSVRPTAHAALFGGGRPELMLANPISSDLDAMRPSLLPNLMAAAGRNADRGLRDVALFEVGPAFEGARPEDQRRVVAGLRAGRTGPRHWARAPREVDVFDAKADALAALAAAGAAVDNLRVEAEAPEWYHPGIAGTLKLGPKVLARFGALHPRMLRAMDLKGPMVGFEVFLDAIPPAKPRPTKARPLLNASPLQPVERDFAFVMGREVPAEAAVRAARGADLLIADVAVFDLYEGDKVGPDLKSLALAVTLQPSERTLTDEEIDAVSEKVVQAVAKATGGRLRG